MHIKFLFSSSISFSFVSCDRLKADHNNRAVSRITIEGFVQGCIEVFKLGF